MPAGSVRSTSAFAIIGVDIVPALIESLRQRAAAGEIRGDYHLADITRDPLPRCDAILCRDCLVHLSFANIERAIANFRRSGATWLITTTFTQWQTNRDCEDGDWRALNFERPPFNWRAPVDADRRALHRSRRRLARQEPRRVAACGYLTSASRTSKASMASRARHLGMRHLAFGRLCLLVFMQGVADKRRKGSSHDHADSTRTPAGRRHQGHAGGACLASAGRRSGRGRDPRRWRVRRHRAVSDGQRAMRGGRSGRRPAQRQGRADRRSRGHPRQHAARPSRPAKALAAGAARSAGAEGRRRHLRDLDAGARDRGAGARQSGLRRGDPQGSRAAGRRRSLASSSPAPPRR